MDKVSILVPIYGVEKFIGRCVRSLFMQTYENIEYIFVDDCTLDESIRIVKEELLHYPTRVNQVKIVRHQTNRGLAAARNTALEHATGKYLLNVDSDDYLEYDAVSMLYEQAESKKADIVVFDSYIEYLSNRHKMHEPFKEDRIEYVKSLLQMEVTPSVWSRFFRRDLYIRSNVRAIEGVNHGEDLCVTPRLIYNAHEIVKLDKCLYNYVQYNNGSYSNNITMKSFDNMIQVCDVLNMYFNSVNDAELFQDSLSVLKLRVKIYLFKHMDMMYYPKIAKLFLCIEDKSKHLLLPTEKLVLLLSKYKLFILLRAYLGCGVFVNKYILLKY